MLSGLELIRSKSIKALKTLKYVGLGLHNTKLFWWNYCPAARVKQTEVRTTLCCLAAVNSTVP